MYIRVLPVCLTISALKRPACATYLRMILSLWFQRHSTSAIRSIEKAIFSLLIGRDAYTQLGRLPSLSGVSALAAFFYLALFRSVRILLRPFFGSNPTWIKNASDKNAVLDIPFREIVAAFREQSLWMQETLATEAAGGVNEASLSPPTIDLAHSSALPVSDERFDAVISSPPYCTRIDYPVKTRPELAILGVDHTSFRALRDQMLGTPTVSETPEAVLSQWGTYCTETLDQIRRHPSRASETYYWKTYIQYFNGLFQSLGEITSALAPGGICFLVVQNSYYKDLFIDLARVNDEMAQSLNLELIKREDFTAHRTMVGINTSARAYTKSQGSEESVLVWKKTDPAKTRRWHMADERDIGVELLQAVQRQVKQIQTSSLDLSFNELLDMHSNQELVIDPEYQRAFRWSETQGVAIY